MAAFHPLDNVSLEIIRRGQREAAPVWRRLTCGAWDVDFDPVSGWLRRCRVGGREVVRAVYGAVRDRHWGTVSPQVHALNIVEAADGFRISFEAECVAANIDFHWRGEIVGDVNGELRFRFAGEARAGFWRNRIGLCVLHPLVGCAGGRCRIETVDGVVTDETFPEEIVPHQPFRQVRAIHHEVAPGRVVEIRFDGDTFETEDQRNWTDASFKTYGTPLAERFPVWIERGTRVEQVVSVRLCDSAPRRRAPNVVVAAAVPELCIADPTARPRPQVGFGLANQPAPLTPRETARLHRLRPTHLRVELRFGDGAWFARWRAAAAAAAAVGTTLQVALFLSDDAARELAALATTVAAHPAPVSLWVIHHIHESSTPARWVRLAETALGGGAPFAAGTTANFAELNRARPAAEETALPCFAINPQAHASDDASLIENLGAQPAVVTTARRFAPRPVVVSPITLSPRASAMETPDEATAGTAPSSLSAARQRSLLAAAWTTGSLARLAALDGIHSLTYFETTGEGGVMAVDAEVPESRPFSSRPGGVFPVFYVFAALAEGVSILPTCSTLPLLLDGFCTIDDIGRRRWAVANLTAIPRWVRVVAGGATASVRILDETNALAAMAAPEEFGGAIPYQTPAGLLELKLNAYAFAQITVEP